MSVRALFFFLLLLPAAHAAPPIEHWQTSNGARVYFIAAPELPIVDVQVVFDAGSARDGAKHGVALLTSSLLAEGAKTAQGELNADQIAERFADLGALFGSGVDRDMASVSVRSLSEPTVLQPALETLRALLLEPTFPQGGLERERRRMLIGLQAQEQSPGSVADKNFFRSLYGEHPYAVQSLGTEQTVKQLTRDDVLAHHARYYVARNAVLAIVGALDRQGAEQLAEALLSKLPAGEAPAPLPKVDGLQEARLVKLTHPSAQTHVLMGQPGLARSDPDYFPLLLGNHILGGSGLVSRLSEEVREKRGLSYSAYSYFQPMRVRGPFTLGLQTRNEQTETALQVLRDTLQAFVENGPSEQELQAAKQNITGGFALRIDSNSKLADYLAIIGFYNLPLDFLDTYTRHVEAVTLEQIKEAFKRRIKPDQMVTVVVGGAVDAKADADTEVSEQNQGT